jgi:hypothetical protein
MRLSIRVLFGIALVAGCASTPPRLAQPVVVDFQWEPPLHEQTGRVAHRETLRQREELLATTVRNVFDTRFQQVVVGGDANAPARVALKVSEMPRGSVVAHQSVPADIPGYGTFLRCGTVEYSIFVSGREASRHAIPLECDHNGFPHYDRALLRAADAAARLLGAV